MYELEKTNNSTVMQSIINICGFIWGAEIHYKKVWLVVMDQASHMLLAFPNLKGMFPNSKHVTCLAHSLHRVCETIREEYDTI
uniref:DUF659 domain-containing protein n=1 Tax=Romanomermis culicivorax TaxID=13658 RepID=A0A915KXL8_ROMCU